MVANFSDQAHWRDSARIPRLFFFDYRAVFPLAYLLIRPSLNALIAVLFTIFLLATLEYFGFSLVVFFRWFFRCLIAGKYRSNRPWWYKN